MAETVKIPIIKGTDADYFDILRTLSTCDSAKAFGLTTLELQAIYAGGEKKLSIEEAQSDEQFQSILGKRGKVYRALVLTGKFASVEIRRTDDFSQGEQKASEDSLGFELGFQKQQPSEQQRKHFVELIADGQYAASSLNVSSLAPLLGEESRRAFEAQQQALTRLQTLHSQVLHELEAKRGELYAEYEKKSAQLDEKHEKRRDALKRRYKRSVARIQEREQMIAEREAEIDARSSTIARREIRKDLKEHLRISQERFSLSRQTRLRRAAVAVAYLALLAVLGYVALAEPDVNVGAPVEASTATSALEYWLFGKRVAATVGFFVTAGLFLRWLNSWAQQHAEEEFKIKQLEFDFDRASWLVEMAFEWGEEKESEMSQQLIDALSSNLFGSTPARERESLTASDAIANALMGSDGTVELDFPGGKVSLDKKALKKARKESGDTTNP